MFSLARVMVIGATSDLKLFSWVCLTILRKKDHINSLTIQLHRQKLVSSYLGYTIFWVI